MRPARARARATRVRAGGAVLVCLLLATGPAFAVRTAGAAPPPGPPLGTVVISHLDPGYTVTSEGPLHPSAFATDAPDPATAAAVLATLTRTVPAYVREWQNDGEANRVEDLLVRFPSVGGAQAFLQAARRALQSGEIVSSGPLAPIPGARRTVYFAAAGQAGVGQAITMRVGTDVDLLSFFSDASGGAPPISPADALRVARAQDAAMVSTPGGTVATTAVAAKKGASIGAVGWAALAVAVLAAAVATPVILRRHRARAPTRGGPPIGSESPS